MSFDIGEFKFEVQLEKDQSDINNDLSPSRREGEGIDLPLPLGEGGEEGFTLA